MNGNPQVEASYSPESSKNPLQSALVVPLEGLNGVVGVLAMYQTNRDAFAPITSEFCWPSPPRLRFPSKML